MNITDSMREYIIVQDAYILDKDPGKESRLSDIWECLSQEERNDLGIYVRIRNEQISSKS